MNVRDRATELLRIPRQYQQVSIPSPPTIVGYDPSAGQFQLRSQTGGITQATPKSSGAIGLGESALSGAGGVLTRPHITVSRATTRVFPPLPGTIKILFGVVRDDEAQYWIGGDRADPLMVFSHTVDDNLGRSIIDPIGIGPIFQSLGSGLDEWCLLLANLSENQHILRTGNGDLPYPQETPSTVYKYGTVSFVVETGNPDSIVSRVVNPLLDVDRFVTNRIGSVPETRVENTIIINENTPPGGSIVCSYEIRDPYTINFNLTLTATKDQAGFYASTGSSYTTIGEGLSVCRDSVIEEITFIAPLLELGSYSVNPGQNVALHTHQIKQEPDAIPSSVLIYTSPSENFQYDMSLINDLIEFIPGPRSAQAYFTPDGIGSLKYPREAFENPSGFFSPVAFISPEDIEEIPSWNSRDNWQLEPARFTAEGLVRDEEITDLGTFSIPPDAAVLAISSYPVV